MLFRRSTSGKGMSVRAQYRFGQSVCCTISARVSRARWGAEADQSGDLIGVFAQVTAQGEHRRGRLDRVAELVPASWNRNRTCSAWARIWSGATSAGTTSRPPSSIAAGLASGASHGAARSAHLSALLLYSAIGSSRSSRSDILRDRFRLETPSLP